MDSNQINIMTSSDERLMPQIEVQFEALMRNLSKQEVRFFLFHDGQSSKAVARLHRFAEKCSNLRFLDVAVQQPDKYNDLSARGGTWGGAAYYSLCAYQYLPSSMDRILYLDAGDTLVVGNIDEYYFADFQGHSILPAAPICFKNVNDQPGLYNRDDLFDDVHGARILRGLFNSGSYVINLDKCRKAGLTIEDCLEFSEALCAFTGKNKETYYGDQGFLSALYAGDMQFYRYPEIKNLWYMPYNFCLWYFDSMIQKVDYKPCIVHYAGGMFKPWDGLYPIFCERYQEREKLRDLNELRLGQAEYYYLWHEYAIMAEQRK